MWRTALLIAGCAPAEPGWLDPSADDAWDELVEEVRHEPGWDAGEVGAQVDLALADGLPLPHPVLDRYRELLTHGDATCPGDTFTGGFLVVGSCTSADGYTYSGSAGLVEEDQREGDPEGEWTGYALVHSAPADYVVTRPDGSRLAVGGNLYVRAEREGSTELWVSRIAGTIVDDGADGWLAGGYSGSIELQSTEEDGATWVKLHGSLTVAGVSLELADLELDDAACPGGVARGGLAVRQPDATWYELEFPEGCGSCGPVTWDRSTELGEACVDPAPLWAAVDAARRL